MELMLLIEGTRLAKNGRMTSSKEKACKNKFAFSNREFCWNFCRKLRVDMSK
jgi:hypothetical protein